MTRTLERLAIDGGPPVRSTALPYGRQWIEDDDINAAIEVLRSDWLTTGPRIEAFERAFAEAVGAQHAVAVSSGTAALHAALAALDIGPGGEVIVPTITFAATATTVLMQGATPVFADVDADTLLMTPTTAAAKITAATRAVVAVDYAGQPCDYDGLSELCTSKGVHLIADACHALGAKDRNRPVGTLADLTAFSFHPVKHIATGEGGMVTTSREEWAQSMRQFRNHGITVDHRQRTDRRDWRYEINELGYNYRLTDIQCAIGTSQLSKLPRFLDRRRALARYYDHKLSGIAGISPLVLRPGAEHAYHLYVVRLDTDRRRTFEALRAEGIGVNVHYPLVHLQPLFRRRCGSVPGNCPIAEREYERILTLPLFAAMQDTDAEDVITAVEKVMSHLL